MQLRATNQKQSKRQVNWIGIILLNIFVVQMIFAAVKRLKEQPYNQREFNKRYLNPLIVKFVGHSTSMYALIHHVGRKSGLTYKTPVMVIPIPNGFLVPLTYGPKVDWCRNILAADSATLQWRGTTYTVVAPEIVKTETVISELPAFQQTIFRMMKLESVLKLQLSTAPVDYVSSKQ